MKASQSSHTAAITPTSFYIRSSQTHVINHSRARYDTSQPRYGLDRA